MPYKIKGKTVIKADTGKVVGHSNNPRKYLAVLQAVEHGYDPNKSPNKSGHKLHGSRGNRA